MKFSFRNLGKSVPCILAACLLILLAAGKTVFALEGASDVDSSPSFGPVAEEPPAPEEDIGEVTSSDPDAPTPSPSPSIQETDIVSYALLDPDGKAALLKVEKGQEVSLTITLKDERAFIGSGPQALINCESFEPLSDIPGSNATCALSSTGNRFTLTFPCRYTGAGKEFSFDLSFPDAGAAMQRLSLKLSQCVEYVPPAPTEAPAPIVEIPEEPAVEKGTGFALKALDYGADAVLAGSRFTLTSAFLVTNGNTGLENVSASLLLPQALSSADGNTVCYLGSAEPGTELTASFALSCDASVEAGNYEVSLLLSGVNAEDGTPVSYEVSLTIPIRQQDRFELSGLSLPETLNAAYDDGLGYLTVSFINRGKSPIYNISITIEGDGLESTSPITYFGNLEPGTEGSADISLSASHSGELNGAVKLDYENAQGEAHTLTQDFTVSAVDDLPATESAEQSLTVTVQEEPPVPGWIWFTVGALLMLLILGIRMLLLRRKRAREALWEEDFPDEGP